MASSPSTPNDDVSRASVVTIPTIVTTVMALVLTLLRLYVRRYMIRILDWDDLFNVLAMVSTTDAGHYDAGGSNIPQLCSLVVMGLVITASHYGLGRHVEFVAHEDASFSVKILRIAEFLLIFSTIFVKISISLFLKRLLYVLPLHFYVGLESMLTLSLYSLTSNKWKIFFWCFIAFNTITSVLDAAVIFPQCTPVEYSWNKKIEGKCWSNEAIDAAGIAQGSKFPEDYNVRLGTYGVQQSPPLRISFCRFYRFSSCGT